MANEENLGQFPDINYFEQIKRDCENGRIASEAKKIADKKESDKQLKENLRKWDEFYFLRTYYDLVWNYDFTRIVGKWNYTSRFKSYGSNDIYNCSFNSEYPADHDYSNDKCVMISEAEVMFYNEDYYKRTLITIISDFPNLVNSAKKEEKVCIIPDKTFVDILETTTHKRVIKNSNKSYYYVMCKVRVNREYNPHRINEKLLRGDVGYIWHTFMGTINPNTKRNIIYIQKPNTTGNKTKSEKVDALSGYTFSESNVKITLEEKNKFANSTNKAKNLNQELIDTLNNAVGKFNREHEKPKITRIHVGFIDYTKDGGRKNAHSDGRAVDLWRIYTDEPGEEKGEQYKCYPYSRIYTSATGKWSYPDHPDVIRDFEEALMQEPVSELLLGPWAIYQKDKDTIPNLICANPPMGELPDEKQYVKLEFEKEPNSEELRKDRTLYEKKLKELAANYKEGLKQKYIKPLIDNGKINEQDTEKVRLHFEHRHHGHYQIKK